MSLLDVEDEEKDEKSLTESENSECKMWQYTTNEIEQHQKGKTPYGHIWAMYCAA